MSGFDKYQLAAIANTDPNVVVLAGAGSGKTTSMLGRVMRALNAPIIMNMLPPDQRTDEMIDPNQVYITSFTNVAADTFRSRLEEHLDHNTTDRIHISTLDSLATAIVRHAYPDANFDFSDTDIAHVIYDKLDVIDKQQYPSFINYYERTVADTFHNDAHYVDFLAYLEDSVKYEMQRIRLSNHGKIKSISLALPMIYILAINIMITNNYIPDIKLLVVDEVQDTSRQQFLFLEFLRTQLPDMKLVCIGDLSQSMYRFNGAYPKNVQNFIKEFNATVLTIPNNYRSNPDIIDYANCFLKENLDNQLGNIQLNACTKVEPDPLIKSGKIKPVNFLDSDKQMLANIKYLVDNGVAYEDIAILCRTNIDLHKTAKLLQKETQYPIFADKAKKSRIINGLRRDISKLKPYVSYLYKNQTEGALKHYRDVYNSNIRRNNYNDKGNNKEFNSLDRYLQPAFDNLMKSDMPVNQKCQTLATLISNACITINDDLTKLMFKDINKPSKPSITISTVHGVKGAQFKYVFYMPSKYRSTQMRQYNYKNYTKDDPTSEERWGSVSEIQNIHYVAITRAIQAVFVVDHFLSFTKQSLENSKPDTVATLFPEIHLLTNYRNCVTDVIADHHNAQPSVAPATPQSKTTQGGV